MSLSKLSSWWHTLLGHQIPNRLSADLLHWIHDNTRTSPSPPGVGFSPQTLSKKLLGRKTKRPVKTPYAAIEISPGVGGFIRP